jgi:hypothetical protein
VFLWLLGAVNLFSLFFVTLFLVAQKHGDELNAHRDIRKLELAILSEQKSPRLSSSWRDCAGTVRKSKTVSINRRIKWGARRTREPSGRRRQASLR